MFSSDVSEQPVACKFKLSELLRSRGKWIDWNQDLSQSKSRKGVLRNQNKTS